MSDIQTQLPVKITDGTNTVSINSTGPALKVDLSQTSSNATDINVNVDKYGGSSTTLGQKTMSASVPVVIASDQSAITVTATVSSGLISTNNSSTATLAANGVFTGTGDDITSYQVVEVTVFADQNSAASGLKLEFSEDNSNWDVINNYAVTALTVFTIQVIAQARYFRIVYTNGSTLQGTFRLQTVYKSSGQPVSPAGVATPNAVVVQGLSGGTALGSNITQIAGSSVSTAATGIIKVGIADSSGTAITLGQTTMASSVPVVIASNQSDVGVNIDKYGGTSTTLGSKVSASSIPVVIASDQGAVAENLTQVGGSAIALGQTTMSASLPVVIASNQSDVGVNIDKYGGTATTLGSKVSASSIPVVIASDQADVGVNIDKYGGTATTLGSKVSASSIPVVIASDQGAIATTPGEVTTGIVASYQTSSAIASGSSGTLTYTVTTGKTLFLKQIIASSSGGPCKVVVNYGSGPTVICVGFYSTAQSYFIVNFGQPISIAAATAVNIVITNNAGAAQDIYGFFNGHEQ